MLMSTGGPPLLDLCIRVVAKLDPALHLVRSLVRVPICQDWLALELGRHRSADRFIPRALRGSVGQVEDLLVEPRGVLRC